MSILTAEQVMAIARKHQPDYCSDTHICFDWQAIADELNAALERGECRNEWEELRQAKGGVKHEEGDKAMSLTETSKPRINHARETIDKLRAYYGKGKTNLTDYQIAEGLEHYKSKAKVDLVVIDELKGDIDD